MKIRNFILAALMTVSVSASVFAGTVSGRITSVAVDPSDPSGNTYYVGTANGGVWKTTDGGGSFYFVMLSQLALANLSFR